MEDKKRKNADLLTNRYYVAFHSRKKDMTKHTWKPPRCHEWHYNLERIPKSQWLLVLDIERTKLQDVAQSLLGSDCFVCWPHHTKNYFNWNHR